MDAKTIREQLKSDVFLRLDDGSKVIIGKHKNDYLLGFEKLGHDTFTFQSLDDAVEFVISINKK